MHMEFTALGSEIERIAQTTKFNNLTLLSNSRTIFAQVGFNSFSNSQLRIDAVSGTLESLSLAAAASSALSYSIIAPTDDESCAAARTALEAVKTAIGEVSNRRGMLGASESRLGVAVNNLQSVRENMRSAESNVREIDTAQEIAKMLGQQIVQQSAAAMFAHANLQPGIALELLKPPKGL